MPFRDVDNGGLATKVDGYFGLSRREVALSSIEVILSASDRPSVAGRGLLVKRYILTGAPGAGKTTILHRLRERGWAIVEEAATDVIAREQALGVSEPWRSGDFIDKIVAVLRERQQQPVPNGVKVQFYDRSPFCTLALARYAGQPARPG
jgi:hypothetical protein